ncbi:MAG: NINE protein [Phormidesmis sp.]
MKNKVVAAVLALAVGWIGVHKFYLGQTGVGIIYLLFSWTGIPAVIAFFECIFLLVMDDRAFDAKYNHALAGSSSSAAYQRPADPFRESTKDKANALSELKKLYEADIITAEEYEEKRRKIFDSI